MTTTYRLPGEGTKCDFCSAEPAWRYPARDFDVTVYRDLEANSQGFWAACPVCHMLIELGADERLARRASRRFAVRTGAPAELIEPEVRRLHDLFRSHRTGPATPMQIKEKDEGQT